MTTNLASLTSGWFRYFRLHGPIRQLIAQHLNSQNAQGAGNRARRRMIALGSVRPLPGETLLWRGAKPSPLVWVPGDRLNAQGQPVQPGQQTTHWIIHATDIT